MFLDRRHDYVGSPFLDEYLFDVELVENVFSQMKRGKAAGLEELTIGDKTPPCLTPAFNS